MVDFPKFQLDSPLDFKNEEALQEELNKSSFKGFAPGEHTAKVTDVKLFDNGENGVFAGDKRWIKVRVEMEDSEGRNTNTLILVPLSTVHYLAKSGKSTTFLYVKFKEFMVSIGEDCKQENFRQLGKKYFGSEKGLKTAVGRPVSFIVGYSKAFYLDRIDQQDWRLMDVKTKEHIAIGGEVLICPDKDSLISEAANLGIKEQNIQQYAEITKFLPSAKKIKAEEEKAPDFEEESWD